MSIIQRISQTYLDHGNRYSERNFLGNTNSQGIQHVSPAPGVSPSTPEYVLRLENMMPIHCLRIHSVTERMKKGKTVFLIMRL